MSKKHSWKYYKTSPVFEECHGKPKEGSGESCLKNMFPNVALKRDFQHSQSFVSLALESKRTKKKFFFG